VNGQVIEPSLSFPSTGYWTTWRYNTLSGAASAKKFAKKNGKNCIATYKKESFADEDLYIIRTQ